MLRAEKAAMNRTQGGEGVAYSSRETEYVDLTKDNELSKRLNGLKGSAKYKAIRDYILEAFGDKDIQLSDGKIAMVDRSDALHIANLSGNKKSAQIAEIKQLINRATLYAEDTKVSHNKFDYFCYYKANVKYGNEIFPIYLNVGKGINDQKYHLYDITEKLRDTVNRIDGFERPKPNEGYALESSVSINSIPNSSENVNNDVSYSAKKSDTVQRITENFGYSDATANSIYKAARTLRKNTAARPIRMSLRIRLRQRLKTGATATPTRAMPSVLQ